MLFIDKKITGRILEEAKSAYPHECCGILVGNDGPKKEVLEIHPVENKNKERAHDRYEIDSKTFDRVDRDAAGRDLKIIGLYHSHPDHPPDPSDFDKECAYVWTDYSYVIVSVRNKVETEMKSWYFDHNKKAVQEEEIM